MREIRSSGSEGGVADNGHPYPYQRCADVGCGRLGDRSPTGGAAPAGPNEIALGNAQGNDVRKVIALKGLDGVALDGSDGA